MKLCVRIAALLALALVIPRRLDRRQKARRRQAPDDGFVPMFNGKDLTGWVNVNCAPTPSS